MVGMTEVIYILMAIILFIIANPSHLSDHIDYGIGIYKYSDFENTTLMLLEV